MALGFAGLLYSFVGNPGLMALALIPTSAILMLIGIGAFGIRYWRTDHQDAADPPS